MLLPITFQTCMVPAWQVAVRVSGLQLCLLCRLHTSANCDLASRMKNNNIKHTHHNMYSRHQHMYVHHTKQLYYHI